MRPRLVPRRDPRAAGAARQGQKQPHIGGDANTRLLRVRQRRAGVDRLEGLGLVLGHLGRSVFEEEGGGGE